MGGPDTWRPTANPAPERVLPEATRERPALPQQQRPLSPGPESLSPETRAGLVEAFYRQQRGGRARRCDGAGESSFAGLWPD